ncbi:hypothetical protein OG864_45445 [Streptomyces sp. NBC_00124]|uniref:hypothetical protein n=1 Tax=Streptomyces sp. NBC_00124 TaxID=2975662 RepID=UPI00224F3810|nr:hypothetical protein [Streptomyces sp. NBC_00124]MCX5365949.1 hypothetical protein [Streptomyces sp. NBC_00124]
MPGGDQERHCGLHLHAFDEAGDDEVDGVDGHLVGFGWRGRCGCLCGLVEGGDDGGYGTVVGRESGGEGQEAFRCESPVGLEVDAVDDPEVGVDVVPVLGDPQEGG